MITDSTATDTVANIVSDAAPVPQAVVAQPVSRFEEQLSLLPDSIETPLREQLGFLPESTVFEIVETHSGGAAILYKEYSQAKQANDIRKAKEDAAGKKALPIAKAKLGDTYYTGKGTETAEFSIGKLVEFQATGLIVVMMVIVGLCLLCYALSFIMQKLGLVKAPQAAQPVAPAVQAPQVPTIAPAKCTLDPNAPSVHPGFTNKQLQAFLSMAAVAALDVHPGLTNDQLAVIFAIAAAEVLGEPCQVVQFRPQNATQWAWVAQGRAELHSNGLR